MQNYTSYGYVSRPDLRGMKPTTRPVVDRYQCGDEELRHIIRFELAERERRVHLIETEVGILNYDR